MLQQTTVTAVLPYYERFLKRFPNIQSVANARDEELLTLWQGLGYYARIRNFKKACQSIVMEHDGVMPSTFADLKNLSGIGNYTAAAIASICFNAPHAVIDGNVKRVLARLYRFTDDITLKSSALFFSEKAAALLDTKSPGDFNQALMELGATVCRPQNPLCQDCPLKNHCAAKDHQPESLPVKKKLSFHDVHYYALVIHHKERLLLKKPAAKNLIANMWGIPLLPNALATAGLKKIGSIKHTITKKKITTHVYTGTKSRNDVYTEKKSRNDDYTGKKSRNDDTGISSRFKHRPSEYEFVAQDQIKTIPVDTLTRKVLKLFYSR